MFGGLGFGNAKRKSAERGWKTFHGSFAVAVRRETSAQRKLRHFGPASCAPRRCFVPYRLGTQKFWNPGTAQKNSLFVCPPAPIAFISGSPPFGAPLTPTPTKCGHGQNSVWANVLATSPPPSPSHDRIGHSVWPNRSGLMLFLVCFGRLGLFLCSVVVGVWYFWACSTFWGASLLLSPDTDLERQNVRCFFPRPPQVSSFLLPL